jgi:hypothetical protein
MTRRIWFVLASVLAAACSNPTSSAQRAPAQRGNETPEQPDDPMDDMGEAPGEEPPPNNGGGSTCPAAASGFRPMASISGLPVSASFDNAVWTGKEMLLLATWITCSGGTCQYSTGARAYDPGKNAWRTIPAPPTEAGGANFAVSVWTGSQWLLVGGSVTKWGDVEPITGGYAFNPSTNKWSALATPPIEVRMATGVFAASSSELIVFNDTTGAAYNPASNTWRTIADNPLPDGRLTPVYANGRVVAAFPISTPEDCDCSFPQNVAASYDPKTDTWMTLPTPPGKGRMWSFTTVMNNHATFFSGWDSGGDGDFPNLHDGLYWDSAAWRTIPNAPFSTSTAYSRDGMSVFSTDGKLYAWGGYFYDLASDDGGGSGYLTNGYVFDAKTSTWSKMPSGGPAGQGMVTVWTGCDAIMFGGQGPMVPDGGGRNTGMLFRP